MPCRPPALQLGAGSPRGWREVLIYPGEFKVRGGIIHADTHSVVGHGKRGPLVLSLADVQLDLEQPRDGYKVVLHEVAHKLDMPDGPAAGVPDADEYFAAALGRAVWARLPQPRQRTIATIRWITTLPKMPASI